MNHEAHMALLWIWVIPAIIAVILNTGLVVDAIRSELRLKASLREQFKPTYDWQSFIVSYAMCLIPLVTWISLSLMFAHIYRGLNLDKKTLVKPWKS